MILSMAHGFSTPLLAKRTESTCTDFTIPVTISATNAQISEILAELLPITELLSTLLGSLLSFTLPVHGIFSISARYCEPAPQYYVASRHDTLQILVHGFTYNKNYCKSLH